MRNMYYVVNNIDALKASYDKFSDEEKAQIDESAKQFALMIESIPTPTGHKCEYELYVDGSSNLADKSGGYAWVLVCDGEPIADYSDGFWDATNSRAELVAAVEGLRAFHKAYPGQHCTVISDSAYVVNCFKDSWYTKWQRNGWRSAKGMVHHRDLWESLITLNNLCVKEWKHVKGHSGNRFNELADRLAGEARTYHVENS